MVNQWLSVNGGHHIICILRCSVVPTIGVPLAHHWHTIGPPFTIKIPYTHHWHTIQYPPLIHHWPMIHHWNTIHPPLSYHWLSTIDIPYTRHSHTIGYPPLKFMYHTAIIEIPFAISTIEMPFAIPTIEIPFAISTIDIPFTIHHWYTIHYPPLTYHNQLSSLSRQNLVKDNVGNIYFFFKKPTAIQKFSLQVCILEKIRLWDLCWVFIVG